MKRFRIADVRFWAMSFLCNGMPGRLQCRESCVNQVRLCESHIELVVQ
ncbi:hypothetical protein C7S15_8211 [Burkholderia cepacia]|nr:hypothetical protein [Burkholderia cepacia]